MKKFLCLILSLIILSALLISCKQPTSQGPATSTGDDAQPTPTEPPADEIELELILDDFFSASSYEITLDGESIIKYDNGRAWFYQTLVRMISPAPDSFELEDYEAETYLIVDSENNFWRYFREPEEDEWKKEICTGEQYFELLSSATTRYGKGSDKDDTVLMLLKSLRHNLHSCATEIEPGYYKINSGNFCEGRYITFKKNKIIIYLEEYEIVIKNIDATEVVLPDEAKDAKLQIKK
jgi:hypothetical protein